MSNLNNQDIFQIFSCQSHEKYDKSALMQISQMFGNL